MRIAVLVAGEMRNFDNPTILAALSQHLFAHHECDVFVSTWERRGESYNQGNGSGADAKALAPRAVTAETVKNTYKYIGARHVEVKMEEERVWSSGLPTHLSTFYSRGYDWCGVHYKGTSVPQFYKIADACRMKSAYEAASGFKYDLVLRTRPDNRFSVDFLPSVLPTDVVCAINCPNPHGSFWPHRIYDIFFFGSSAAMDVVAGGAFGEYMDNVSHPFNNGLHAEDSCRLLFVQAQRHGIRVGDVDCDIVLVER